MKNSTTRDELVSFFKALADENRLKIVGILANRTCTVDEIATLLGISPSTASHHLSRLSKAGLVTARAEGHYYHYSLHTQILQDMARSILSQETMANLHPIGQPRPYDEKVLAAFLDDEGRIISLPVQEKKFAAVLRYTLGLFETGKKYTEKEVNEILARFHEDTASLRRGLVEHRMLERTNDGTSYWLTGGE